VALADHGPQSPLAGDRSPAGQRGRCLHGHERHCLQPALPVPALCGLPDINFEEITR